MKKILKKIMCIVSSMLLLISLAGAECRASEMNELTIVCSSPEVLLLADGTTQIAKGGEFTITTGHKVIFDYNGGCAEGSIMLDGTSLGTYNSNDSTDPGVVLEPGKYTWNVNWPNFIAMNVVFTKTGNAPEPGGNTGNYIAKLEKELDNLLQEIEIDTDSETESTEKTVEWNEGDSLPISVMQKLKDAEGVSLLFSFTYEGVEHKVMIPAGESFVDDDIEWYGPLWLLGKYGEYDPAGKEYVIESGDSLAKIAKKLGKSVGELLKLNPQIKNPAKIYAGQTINY